ncbi:hypothetical protein [Tahibacter sp.]|uniref:hypothetical protein n=1 Tax=Tahibacter sp. TaxID=2056211 RepID=UPI0028C4BCBA|nr:hypothetical protein [Tahibacter sp.]
MKKLPPRLHRTVPFMSAMASLLFAAAASAGQGDLSIRIDDDLTHATPGRPITYSVTTHNAGPDAVEGLLIAATVPAASCTWTCGSAAGQCQTTPALGANLPAGAESRHVATCTVPASATGSWTAHAALQPPDDFTDLDSTNDESSDTTQITPRGILTVALSDGLSHLTAGDPIAYALSVSNAGPDAIDGAHVAAVIPPQYTDCTWTCSGTGGATCAGSGSGTIADSTAYLPANHSVNYVLSCTVAHGPTGLATTRATVRPPLGSVNINPVPGAGSEYSDSNSVVTGPITDTAIELVAPARIENPGGNWDVSYGISVINRGATAAPVLLSGDFGMTVQWVCETPNCPIASGSGTLLRQNVVLPPRSRLELTAGGVGFGYGLFGVTASVTAPPNDPAPENNSAAAWTQVPLSPPPPPPGDGSIAAISLPPPRVALGDAVYYRFRLNAPTQADFYATIVLPPYVDEAVPTCVNTTGSVTCTVFSPSPLLTEGKFTYMYHIKVIAGGTADIALNARISRRPFADYWSEALRVTGSTNILFDMNPIDNSVNVDTALSLFRGSFDVP